MAREDAEFVRDFWAEIAEWINGAERGRDRAAEIAARYASENLVYEEDPVWPDAGTYRGRDAVSARFLEYTDMLQIKALEPGKTVDGGDLIFQEVDLRMLGGDAQGESVKFLWGYTFKVEDGRIVHFRAWFDPEEGRRAAGLSD